MADRYRSMVLLVSCLSLLPEDIKRDITDYTDRNYLDRALHEMMQERVFPAWFSNSFPYDKLHEHLVGLRELFSLAIQSLLMQYDGTQFNHHVIMSDSVRVRLLKQNSIPEADIVTWAIDLEKRLLELESENEATP